MASQFKRDSTGYYAYHDPEGDLRYGFTCWLADRSFSSASWAISGGGSPSPELHDAEINLVAMTIDGVSYAAGQVASVQARKLESGNTYTVTLHATFDDGQKDDRSFRLICQHR